MPVFCYLYGSKRNCFLLKKIHLFSILFFEISYVTLELNFRLFKKESKG